MTRTGDRHYRRKRAQLLNQPGLICAWCGLPIDTTLKSPHPMSPSADHITPIAAGGHNHGDLQPMHLGCNKSAGAKGHRHTNTKPSHIRDW